MRAIVALGLLVACGHDDPGTPSDTTERVLEGPFTGIRVSASSDLTGDGAADVVISAPGLDGSGAVWVVDAARTGRIGADQVAARFATGVPGDVGEGLSACGDTDGDGAADLLIGAPYAEEGEGGAWLLSGPLSGEVGADGAVFLRGDEDEARHGWTVACDGDFDADGIADLAITAPDAPGYGQATQAGQVSFLRGTPDGPAGLGSLSTTFSDSHLGTERSIVLADLDGDGFDEAIVGSPGTDRVHLLFDPIQGAYDPNAAGVTWTSHDDALGSSVAVGDLDGDGHPELIVGAPTFGADRGRVAVFDGPIDADAESGTIDGRARWIEGQDDGERVGFALAVAALDGDGRDDLLVGAPGAVTVGPEAGAVYVLHGDVTATTVSSADAVILGAVSYGGLGWSLSAVPTDGGDRILVGAPYADVDGRIGAGAAYLFGGGLSGQVGADDAVATYVF